MQDFIKMIEALFESFSGNNESEENVKTENMDRNHRVKQACRTALSGMKREIDAMGHVLIMLDARRDALIDEYNALVKELKDMDGGSESHEQNDSANRPEAPSQSVEKIDQDSENVRQQIHGEAWVPPWLRKKVDAEESAPATNPQRGHKEKSQPEFKRLPKHRPTGNARLDTLETALHDALERLNNTKMAYHFIAIKEMRLALSNLYKSWDKPEEERIVDLEAGLKDAVDKLSENPNAAQSKIMPDIWGDLIVALKSDNH